RSFKSSLARQQAHQAGERRGTGGNCSKFGGRSVGCVLHPTVSASGCDTHGWNLKWECRRVSVKPMSYLEPEAGLKILEDEGILYLFQHAVNRPSTAVVCRIDPAIGRAFHSNHRGMFVRNGFCPE